jgi:glycosyltransferase involved in cell wall biosynthesis
MTQNHPGLVSIIVPARNEEANIEPLVRSLAAQREVREILIVDDQSEDRTREILEAMKAETPLLQVLAIDSLPEGWLGKTHAVAEGAGVACLHLGRSACVHGQWGFYACFSPRAVWRPAKGLMSHDVGCSVPPRFLSSCTQSTVEPTTE